MVEKKEIIKKIKKQIAIEDEILQKYNPSGKMYNIAEHRKSCYEYCLKLMEA